ncbi:YjbQ family protein [candidate division WOR-3 bacterium]|uniref:YjbQ family protein n=1 Tax=candidate division WOR-3 bacterium TaxID=2052148 RepID=A0A660SFI9_UNCW3|nr:MAG: YjbQ family protein [candidate division WOR-3 bacterium]
MDRITVETTSRIGLYDITDRIRRKLKESKVKDGILVVYVPHTTAAVTINENYDPSVVTDINQTLSRLIPYRSDYAHTEGNADAHIKAAIVGSSRQVIIEDGDLRLGRWQGIFFCEFDGPRRREVWIEIITRR